MMIGCDDMVAEIVWWRLHAKEQQRHSHLVDGTALHQGFWNGESKVESKIQSKVECNVESEIFAGA